MNETCQPFVCDECKKLNKNWYAPCPHAPMTGSATQGEGQMHEPKLYAAEGPITGHERKYTIASVGCTCGWNSDGKSYNKEGDWYAHLRAALASQESTPGTQPQDPLSAIGFCEHKRPSGICPDCNGTVAHPPSEGKLRTLIKAWRGDPYRQYCYGAAADDVEAALSAAPPRGLRGGE